jgi:ERCC4-related helicase
VRSDSDPDVKQYSHKKLVEIRRVELKHDILEIKKLLLALLEVPFRSLQSQHAVFNVLEASKLSQFMLLKMRESWRKEMREQRGGAPARGAAMGRQAMVEAEFGIAVALCSILKLLETHGITAVSQKLIELG